MAQFSRETAEGYATVLAIGKANPPNEFLQSEYPDYYFKVTNNEDKPHLKEKFARICAKSAIKKRHLQCSEELLKANPAMCDYNSSSLSTRLSIAAEAMPKLGAEAAEQALKEWGQPREQITHVVFATTTGVSMPGPDVKVTRLLGLNRNVKRTMLFQTGCTSGASVMRIAKDLAENNEGARVLTVVSELICVTFRGPNEDDVGSMVGAAIFSDGASALIIGSHPLPVERPLYEICWSGQTILPESDGAIEGHLTESGMFLQLVRDVPGIISRNTLPIFKKALAQIPGSPGWNDIFWVVHPGGRAILDQLEIGLSLKPEKLEITRDVLSNYGNMAGASIHFVMDQFRNESFQKDPSSTEDAAEWGLAVAFGPGLTVEVLVLKCVASQVSTVV